MIQFYNDEVRRFGASHPDTPARKDRSTAIDSFIRTDPTKMSWDRPQKVGVARGRHIEFDADRIAPCLYRPFTKLWLYFDPFFNNCVYQIPRILPKGAQNRIILVNRRWLGDGQLAILTDAIPDAHTVGDTQCFPLYIYDPVHQANTNNTRQVHRKQTSPRAIPRPRRDRKEGFEVRRDGITDACLAHFQASFPGPCITKEDIFYYVYGILHARDFREHYTTNLRKEILRIPCVRSMDDFWTFAKAGEALGNLHIHYEDVPEYPATVDGPAEPTASHYRVEKMRFGKGSDKTVIHYNEFFTVHDIPIEAYAYVVNGKSAIQWVMERQSVTVDRTSGMTRDANVWATETVGDPRYPLSLLLRVISVSLETVRIVDSLPTLDIQLDAAGSSPCS